MAKLNRAEIIKRLQKVLKKHFTPVPTPADRTVLEHLLFACCLEDARHELAEECFARVQQLYFDWNEIRVTSSRELAEVFSSLPEPQAAATRMKSSLQSIFESRYEFDLEFLRKLKLQDAQKKLASFKGPTLFVQAYVTQAALGGHAIPTSEGALQVMEVVGAATSAEVAAGEVPGLERVIPKNQGMEFSSLLHSLGALLKADPFGPTVKEYLVEVNPDAAERIPKRTSRRPAEPAPRATEPIPAHPDANSAGKSVAGGKTPVAKGSPDKKTGAKLGELATEEAVVESPAPGKAPAAKDAKTTKPEPAVEKGVTAKGPQRSSKPGEKDVKDKSEREKSDREKAEKDRDDKEQHDLSGKGSATAHDKSMAKGAPAKGTGDKGSAAAKPPAGKPQVEKLTTEKPIADKGAKQDKDQGAAKAGTSSKSAKPEGAKPEGAKPEGGKPDSGKGEKQEKGHPGNAAGAKPTKTEPGKGDPSKSMTSKSGPAADASKAHAKPEAKPANKKVPPPVKKGPPANGLVDGKDAKKNGGSSPKPAGKKPANDSSGEAPSGSKASSKQLSRRKPR